MMVDYRIHGGLFSCAVASVSIGVAINKLQSPFAYSRRQGSNRPAIQVHSAPLAQCRHDAVAACGLAPDPPMQPGFQPVQKGDIKATAVAENKPSQFYFL
jgi:hypothetical protein